MRLPNLLSIISFQLLFHISTLGYSQDSKTERLILQYKLTQSSSDKEIGELHLQIIDKYLNEGDYNNAVSLNAKTKETIDNKDEKYFLSGKAEFLVDNYKESLSFLNKVSNQNLDKYYNNELQLYKTLNYNHLLNIDSASINLINYYKEQGKDTSGILSEIKMLTPPKLYSLKKAHRKSALLPGYGLYYVRERKHAFGSAFLNFAFLGYTAYSIYSKYYITATLTGISQFLRFYGGGKKASVKIGNRKNTEALILYLLKTDDYFEKKYLDATN